MAGESYDQLQVTGDASIEGSVVLEFIDGFAPKTGDAFDLIVVGGDLTIIGSSIGIQGLEEGFEYEFGLGADGQTQLRALNDGVFGGTSDSMDPSSVPEPSSCLIWVLLIACFACGGRQRLMD